MSGVPTWRGTQTECPSGDRCARYATTSVTRWLIRRLVTPRGPSFCTYFGVVSVTGRGCLAVACHEPRCPSAHTQGRWSTPRRRDYMAPKGMKVRDIPLEGPISSGTQVTDDPQSAATGDGAATLRSRCLREL